MAEQTKPIYEFGPFRIDTAQRVLLREGKPVSLTPKAFEVLMFLVERRGRIVEKDELMNRVWADSFVEEGNLKVTVSMLRKVLEESSGGPQLIETVPRRGYRFVADVSHLSDHSQDVIVLERSRADVIIEEETDFYHGQSARMREPQSGSADEPSSRTLKRPMPVTEIVLGAVRSNKAVAVSAVATLTVVAAAAFFGVYKFVEPRKASSPFEIGEMTRLTTNGRAASASISPDGKYVVYATLDLPETEGERKETLWLWHVATNSSVQILQPAVVHFNGATFSPDGNYIYYLVLGKSDPMGSLYQIPVLGGTPKRILTGIFTPITFSPDGNRFASVRSDTNQNETAIIVANRDGGVEEKLASRKGTDYFIEEGSGPAWSPDGEVIACAGGSSAEESSAGLFEVRVRDGTVRQITSHKWDHVARICWLTDGKSLLLEGKDHASGNFFHLWQVSYPEGEVRRLTNEIGGYGAVSLGMTADSQTLVATKHEINSNIWTMPMGAMTGAKQITAGVGRLEGFGGVSWTPDDRIVYVAIANGEQDIWIMDSDGKNQRRLTEDGADASPSVTGDGRYIVYVSWRTGIKHIWRMDIDGGNQRQLTDHEASEPQCSPDGHWVVYSRWDADKVTICKVPIDGGTPVELTGYPSTLPVISPDGKLIATMFLDEVAQRWRATTIPFAGGNHGKAFDISTPAGIGWTADSRSLLYVKYASGTRNIWRQPTDGGREEQLTDFKEDRIFHFDLSKDGKDFVIARGPSTADLVLISNARNLIDGEHRAPR
jgi:DNA-binding winged helix-turn-helix (wHTH) protein/Tol biopolymer transport system component